MSSVVVYVVGFSVESIELERICSRAYTLDKADFLDSGYPIKDGGGPSSSSKRKLRSSQESPAKRKVTPVFDDVENISTDEEEDDDDKGDDHNVGSDEMPTPMRRSSDVPGWFASSMLPPLSQTLRTPTPSGRPHKKSKTDPIASVVQQLTDF